MINKKIAGAALAASLLGGTAFGSLAMPSLGASAADDPAAATAPADRNPGQWITDALKGLVDKGTINQQQSDAVAGALKDAQPKGGPGGPHGGPRMSMAKTAEVLGISEADLKEQLKTKSIADVAKDKGVDLQKVIDALVAEENTRIDKSVTDGKATQAQADERKTKTVERVTNLVNHVRGDLPPGGQGGPRGERPDGPEGESAPAPAA